METEKLFVELYVGIDSVIPVWTFYERLGFKGRTMYLHKFD